MADPSSAQIPPTKYTTQQMQNYGFDADFHEPTIEVLGYDPSANVLRRLNLDSAGNLAGQSLTTQLDYVGGTNPIYLGYAVPGTLTSAASWLIKKVSYDANNNVTAITYAGGSATFANIWDNRTALTYS